LERTFCKLRYVIAIVVYVIRFNSSVLWIVRFRL